MNTLIEIDYGMRREHVLKLIEREGLSQIKLAEKINISAQNMNSMCRGKRNITEATARAIKQQFPDYRLPWLLGDDDYEPTQAEYDARESDAFREDCADQNSEDALSLLAKVNGWKITADGRGFTFSKGNLSFVLTVWGLENLREEIAEHANMRFKQLARNTFNINAQPGAEAEE